jgi:hypothetical protein
LCRYFLNGKGRSGGENKSGPDFPPDFPNPLFAQSLEQVQVIADLIAHLLPLRFLLQQFQCNYSQSGTQNKQRDYERVSGFLLPDHELCIQRFNGGETDIIFSLQG